MEMVCRKWEDLNMDCLVNIFGRVGMENLLLNVPYVCKSWYKAACNPQCWSTLDFTEGLFDEPYRFYDSDSSDTSSTDVHRLLLDEVGFIQKYRICSVQSLNSFFKFVAKRGNICATHLKIPAFCTKEAIDFMSNECPNIKTLQLPKNAGKGLMSALPSLVSKWKRLENLSFPWFYKAGEIFQQLSTHCMYFKTLEFFYAFIVEDDASALVTHLPNLKGLSMMSATITKEDLITILKSCTKLECLEARECVGFDENDADILNAAAHICTAKLQGSTMQRDDEEDYRELYDNQEYSKDFDFYYPSDSNDFYYD